jgi:hypothetical protein
VGPVRPTPTGRSTGGRSCRISPSRRAF